MKLLLIIINIIFCGLITCSITMFLAGGAIGENYTDSLFVAPHYFLILPIWGIGVSLLWLYFYKKKLKNVFFMEIILINIIPWIALFLGVFFTHWVL
ncbi:hypothetical protein J2Z64_004447 [Oceanobacillus polygoni]|uniref:Uncharacterized protein n=1 Tax=Oceanobacillus polygoni TaxID=1235259 RepID=A0A9X0Z2K8_9BACI|nr:hypothetical protein [Oceanobacillus polygoni]